VAIGQTAQLMSPYNSNAPKPNYTKPGCNDSLDIVVIPVVLAFPEFLFVSAQRLSKYDSVNFEPPIFFFWGGGDFRGGTTINE